MVEQTKKHKIEIILTYIGDETASAQELLEREEDANGVYDATYKGTLDGEVKNKVANVVKILRWLIDDLSLPTPNAFTDTQIDAINPDIRTING